MRKKLIQIKMKNLKSIIYLSLLLLMISSCTSDNDNLKTESQQIDYEKLSLGLKENVVSFSKMIEYDESLSNDVNEFIETGDESIFLKKNYKFKQLKKKSEDKILYNKEDLSDVYSEKQKEFLVSFYNDLSNSENGYILDIVLSYKKSLNKQNFNLEEYHQINTILISSEQSILVLDGVIAEDENSEEKSSFSSKNSDCGFWCCMRKNAGRAIGRGIAQGAIIGGISGAFYGATGGTIVLPGIGTATGAVGGAVFGAAAGAVSGAVGNAIWQAVDCGGGGALKQFLEEVDGDSYSNGNVK